MKYNPQVLFDWAVIAHYSACLQHFMHCPHWPASVSTLLLVLAALISAFPGLSQPGTASAVVEW